MSEKKTATKRKKKRKKYIILLILLIIFFLFGMVLFAYPFVSRYYIEKNSQGAISEFERERNEFIQSAGIEIPEKPQPVTNANNEVISYIDDEGVLFGEIPEEQIYLDELYQFMKNTNIRLYETKQENFKDSSSYTVSPIDLTKYGVKSGVVGQIEIDKLKVTLPIFLGINDENLAKGYGHLTETSYPIGGVNTSCVVAAHRGYGGADMLRYVENLVPGDVVKVTNFWYTMEYQVTEIKIIEPDDVKTLLIQPGRDILILFTCHPYGINNQRYLVYCERR